MKNIKDEIPLPVLSRGPAGVLPGSGEQGRLRPQRRPFGVNHSDAWLAVSEVHTDKWWSLLTPVHWGKFDSFTGRPISLGRSKKLRCIF